MVSITGFSRCLDGHVQKIQVKRSAKLRAYPKSCYATLGIIAVYMLLICSLLF